jgi:hypothetical protein
MMPKAHPSADLDGVYLCSRSEACQYVALQAFVSPDDADGRTGGRTCQILMRV